MIRILLGPFVVGTILSPPNTTSVAPNNTSINSRFNTTTAAPTIPNNNNSLSLNVSSNQTQPTSLEYPPKDNLSASGSERKANVVKVNYPYVVSINRADRNLSSYQICSGSILTASVVLSACQCIGNVSSDGVKLYPANSLLIIAGTSKATENSTKKQAIFASSLEPHSKCRRIGQIVLYDLALIFLETQVMWKTGVGTVNVLSSNTRSVMDEYYFILKFKAVCYSPGWGYLRPRPDEQLTDLVDNPVWIISDDECRQSYCLGGNQNLCTARFETQGHICAMPYRNASPCHEDVGGPLICDKRLYGVITNSVSCSCHLPQLYVSPHVVLQFIEKFVPSTDTDPSHFRSMSVSSKHLCLFLLWSTTMISIIV